MAVFCLTSLCSFAQQSDMARKILDETSAVLNNKGIKATFTIASSGSGNMSGSIQMRGNKFLLSTPHANTWFDGKTEWSYVKTNKEVNVSNPTDAQLKNLNPYAYINSYKTSFNYKYNGMSADNYSITLLPKSASMNIKNVLLFISKNKTLKKIIITQKDGKKQTITVHSFQSGINYGDSSFRFSKSKFPGAEVIDLR